MGFPRNICTRDTGTGFKYFTSVSFFFIICFLLQVLPVNLQPLLPSAKKQEQKQSRLSGSWGVHNPQTQMRITSPDQSGQPPAAQPSLHTGPEAAGTNCGMNMPRCNKPKQASFHSATPRGCIATLKEGLDIPAARFGLPRNKKAGFKITVLSPALWGNSKANRFSFFWTDTKFKKQKPTTTKNNHITNTGTMMPNNNLQKWKFVRGKQGKGETYN